MRKRNGVSIRHLMTMCLTVISGTLVASQAPEPATHLGAIADVIAGDTKLELVKDGFESVEGPTTTPDGGIYFSAYSASRIYFLDKNGVASIWRENTGGANGLYLTRDGHMLACEMRTGKRIVSISKTGEVVPLVTEFQGKPLRDPNDVIEGPNGGVYFTDPVIANVTGSGPKQTTRVLYRQKSGKVLLIDDQIGFPNGLTLSLDEKTLYVDDTMGEYVFAYDVQSDGSTKNKRTFVKLLEPQQSAEGPRSMADGLTIDSKGRLYVTSAAGIQVISPTGQHLGIIRAPGSGLAFGGSDRRTLYVGHRKALYRIRMLAQGAPNRSK